MDISFLALLPFLILLLIPVSGLIVVYRQFPQEVLTAITFGKWKKLSTESIGNENPHSEEVLMAFFPRTSGQAFCVGTMSFSLLGENNVTYDYLLRSSSYGDLFFSVFVNGKERTQFLIADAETEFPLYTKGLTCVDAETLLLTLIRHLKATDSLRV